MKMERFENEFVSWSFKTPVGIKVEQVFGMDSKSGKVWLEMARQIFSELGAQDYREIGHYSNGAPFIFGLNTRISISHTSHFLVGAFLPKTPEANLEIFAPRTALGVDAESIDRSQVISVRDKFLTEKETEKISKDDVRKNIIAWTCKEALYKAAMTPGLDWRKNLVIEDLPEIDLTPEKTVTPVLGKGYIELPLDNSIERFEMRLYSYECYGCCVSIAFSPKCARFGKK